MGNQKTPPGLLPSTPIQPQFGKEQGADEIAAPVEGAPDYMKRGNMTPSAFQRMLYANREQKFPARIPTAPPHIDLGLRLLRQIYDLLAAPLEMRVFAPMRFVIPNATVLGQNPLTLDVGMTPVYWFVMLEQGAGSILEVYSGGMVTGSPLIALAVGHFVKFPARDFKLTLRNTGSAAGTVNVYPLGFEDFTVGTT